MPRSKARYGKQEKKEKILRLIARGVIRNGYQPSYREIAKLMGHSSVGYVFTLIDEMKRDGLLEVRGSRAVAFQWQNYV